MSTNDQLEKNDDIVLSCQNVKRSFVDGSRKIDVLNGINLELSQSESLAVIGASGSGKTTLLQILGGLDTPTEGQVEIVGHSLSGSSEAKRSELRNQYLGFVYQFHHLLPEFSALENVAMPLLIRRTNQKEAFQLASDMLEKVGLAERLEHKPSMLSGGERQRTAIARALVTSPALLLADEPTGNLDDETGQGIIDLLQELKKTASTSMIIVTHDKSVAQQMDKIMTLDHGLLKQVL